MELPPTLLRFPAATFTGVSFQNCSKGITEHPFPAHLACSPSVWLRRFLDVDERLTGRRGRRGGGRKNRPNRRSSTAPLPGETLAGVAVWPGKTGWDVAEMLA